MGAQSYVHNRTLKDPALASAFPDAIDIAGWKTLLARKKMLEFPVRCLRIES